jgi:hypothetical protein
MTYHYDQYILDIIFLSYKKITLNHALLKLSHMNDEIVGKLIYNLSIHISDDKILSL